MSTEERVGKVQTVTGLMDADCLGITLPHEHLITDLSTLFLEPTEASDKARAYQPITMENLGWVHTHRHQCALDNRMNNEDLAIKEVLLYKQAGGNTIVEVSNIGLARDPLGLARISRAAGLNVIMGSGYYMAVTHPPAFSAKTEDEITEEIVRDITVGVGNTGIRAGIIGEIGCSVPLDDAERKVLRASAKAQRLTGAALTIHPSIDCDAVLETISIVEEAGADLSHTIICHCDVSNLSPIFDKLLAAGCYIEFDTFGAPAIPLSAKVCPEGVFVEFPSDMWRVREIKSLIEKGYLEQILISHDICQRQLCVAYGGYGYAHILCNVVPWMQRTGISDEQINTLIVENPKRVLTFASV